MNEYGNALELTVDTKSPSWDDWQAATEIVTHNVKATEKALAERFGKPYAFDSVEFYCKKDSFGDDLKPRTLFFWRAFGA